jgi:hypothetical protein
VAVPGRASSRTWIISKTWGLLPYVYALIFSIRGVTTNIIRKIWISPVVSNLVGDSSDGEAYHGYWAQNIYEVNNNFGSATDLLALSKALHNADMYLMVDIVTNHMGYLGCGSCVQYNIFNPFNSVRQDDLQVMLY